MDPRAVESSRIRRTPALDDPGRDGGGRRPGAGPGEGGRLLGRRARPAAAGPDARNASPSASPVTACPSSRSTATCPRPRTSSRGRELARACRCSKIIWHGWPRDPRFDSLAGLRDLVSACNEAGAIARDHGLAVRHAQPLVGVRAGRGGAPDPAAPRVAAPRHLLAARRLLGPDGRRRPGGRARGVGAADRSLHWKDGPAVHGEPMTALGRGRSMSRGSSGP